MTGHEAVLKREALEGLVVNESGTYVDCTYGRGGHAEQILERLNENGRMMVIDKDIEAINHANQRFAGDSRVTVMHGSFRHIKSFCEEAGFNQVDGIFIDLGISSPQIDQAERGFSFDRDGPLDMRMDQTRGETVSEWLQRAEPKDISYVLYKYGEEKFSRRIARNICTAREAGPIETTHALVSIIEDSIPRRDPHKHPATRSFQALRIFINDELGDLEVCLEDSLTSLSIGGRLVVISFHSLEDRIVKRFIRTKARCEELPSRFPIRDADIKRFVKIIGKPVKPSDEEVDRNRRSRSSIMRIAEKIG